jgi:hypothetical protein
MLKARSTAWKVAIFFAIVSFIAAAIWLYASCVASRVPWQRDLAPLSKQGDLTWARTIIHMHSVYSHDACDWRPIEDGHINERCLADIREAVCRDHVDVLFLTEHNSYLSTTSFNSILNPRGGDTLVWKDGNIVESVQHCPDGHQVHLFPGAEDYLMPLALVRRPEGGDYGGKMLSSLDNLRHAAGLLALSHVEHPLKTVSQIRAMHPDLMEVYNLHANLVATTRRRQKWMVVKRVFRFLQFLPKGYLEPDLSFLAFFSEDEIALAKWGKVTRDLHVTGIVGTDAHQNAFPWKMNDGERLDSYRRTMRWFSNFVQVPDLSRDAILAALKAGKVVMAFEVFGTPEGFGFSAMRDGKEYGLGDSVETVSSAPVTLSLKLPTIRHRDPAAPQPVMVLRLLRATDDGWEEVTHSVDRELTYVASQPGTYRAEVRMKPRHLAPFLLGATKLIGYRPWLYFNPIYLR